MTGSPYVFVDTPQGLAQAAQALSTSPRLYLDTEFESGRGPTRLCLLQIASGTDIFLVDTLRLSDLQLLTPVLARPEVEWVLHAGLQDIALIEQRLHARAPERLFDTQVAYALVSAENNVSLSYLRHVFLGIAADKAHQADDWLRRPLPESQLRYAASDVQHLPALTELLTQRAAANDRVALIHQASHEALLPSREPPPLLTLESFRNAWQLGPRSQAGLRYLIEWHNQLPVADKLAAPDNKTLLAVAARMPESPDALSRIKGISPGFVKRHAAQLVQGLKQRALQASSADFVPLAPLPYATFADIRNDAWLGLLRAEVCAALEVSPDHVLPPRVVRELRAKLQERPAAPLSGALRGYRKQLLASAIDDFCNNHPPPLT